MSSSIEKSKASVKSKGWTPFLILLCVTTTIGTAIPAGYCLGVMNTPAEFIKTWCSETLVLRYNLLLSTTQIDILWTCIVSIFLVGGICGSFAGALCCEKLGRKGTLLISALLLIIAGILLNFCRIANSVEMMFIGRLISGIAASLICTAHPMYLLECAPSNLRGSVAVFTSIGMTGGIFIGQIVSLHQVLGTESLWQYALSFFTLLVVLAFLPAYWLPESPSWLYVVKQNFELARFELERLRGKNAEDVICSEIADMKLIINAEPTEKTSLRSVLKNSELLLPLVIVCSFQICQQLSGINAIFYYSIPIFTKAGFSVETAEWMNLGAGFLNFFICATQPALMLFNRRPLMMLSCACCSFSLFVMAFALNYIDLADWLPAICIIFIAAFIFVFNLGLAPIPYFIGSELFDISTRPVAMSMGSFFSWSGNLMIGMVFPIVQGFCGSFAFLPCSITCLYCFLLTWRYVPETRGREVADLKPLMSNGFKSIVRNQK